ncbi:MAG TPA: hypothetical protein DEH25_03675 [Chloroflexi bacterium]|nr:hypothetical protein [Chloroflexota bacterium]HBY07147.1 hypothetical protein [Chloroflexota bacterium]
MQDQENEIISPESTESPEPNMSAEPVDIFPETEGAEETEETGDDKTDQPKEETRSRLFFRKVIRWTAGLLLVFGLGFLAAIFSIYNPKVDELGKSQNEIKSASDTISELEGQIAALQDQISRLNGQIDTLNQNITNLEEQNQALVAEQNDFNLHIALLKARADITNAQVEIFDGNPAQAKVLLQSTDQTLTAIESLLPDDLKDVVAPLHTRLNLALGEIENDPETAIDDLSILAGDLLEIENALFGN